MTTRVSQLTPHVLTLVSVAALILGSSRAEASGHHGSGGYVVASGPAASISAPARAFYGGFGGYPATATTAGVGGWSQAPAATYPYATTAGGAMTQGVGYVQAWPSTYPVQARGWVGSRRRIFRRY